MNIHEQEHILTKEDICSFLKNNGIRHDDKVTVHASLRAVGPIEGGADGLIDAMCAYLNQGLLIIPTHTWDEVVRATPYYDVKTSVPCIGTLAKVAAFRKDGVRSLHPTHSVTVFGQGAEEFVRGEELCASPAPANSCLSRLYEEHGKVLLIGVGHERNTYLHAVDERLGIPDRLNPDPFVITIRDYDGNLLQSPPFRTHYCAMSDRCVSEYYPNYKEAFEYTGAVKYGRLGDALVYVCDARSMTDTVRELWKRTDHDLCIRKETIPESYYKDINA
ncbi:MAG: AAC(3) family N-acetyltransferase [Clostridiales bacterium]|nr:AAC(3) family N-acetyltransferase [Clostridiales bacterium]